MTRYAKKQAEAGKRRRLHAHQRLQHQRAQAQLYIEALHQALEDLDVPDTLVAEIEGRLQTQHPLLGKIVGLMFPTLFGCRHSHELTRVWGWNKNIPSLLTRGAPQTLLAQTPETFRLGDSRLHLAPHLGPKRLDPKSLAVARGRR